ncbi:MAG: hypothetical protein M1816_001888 [Peltula sp. TS41687]|nr:MAG: hypothetical protein M1816_001888 [Peltula sp. TS41687]
MEDPDRLLQTVKEIPYVISALTQTPPSIQQRTIETYFLPNASFAHPFARVGSSSNSRWLIWMVYRWYKIMSPRIDLTVNSVAFDQTTLRLYVDISQVFRLWIVPFYAAHVNLVTVIDLVYDPKRRLYFVQSQHDLYQVNEWVKFIWPGGWLVLLLWQYYNTFLSVIGAILLSPISWYEENILC